MQATAQQLQLLVAFLVLLAEVLILLLQLKSNTKPESIISQLPPLYCRFTKEKMPQNDAKWHKMRIISCERGKGRVDGHR